MTRPRPRRFLPATLLVVVTALDTLGGGSVAVDVNARGWIVGSGVGSHGTLWHGD